MRKLVTLVAAALLVLVAAPSTGRGQDEARPLGDVASRARAAVAELGDSEEPDEIERARQSLRALLAHADAWLVADELRLAGLTDSALRVAELVGGPDVVRLPEYLRSVSGSPPDARARAALAAYDEARAKEDWEAAEQALAPAQEFGDDFEKAWLCLALGNAHRARGEHDAALHVYDVAWRRCSAVGWVLGADKALTGRTLVARDSLRWSAAEESLRQLITLDRERGLARKAAQSQSRLGYVLLMAGDMRGAATEYERAIDALSDLDAPYLLGWSQQSLGWAYLQLGRYRDAQVATERAIGPLRAAGRTADVLGAELQLASIHAELGQYGPALDIQERVLADALESNQAAVVARAKGEIGRSLQRLGRLDDAERQLQEVHAAFAQAGDEQGACQALVNLANVSREKGEPETAHSRYETALRAAKELGDPWLICNVLHDLAVVTHLLGDRKAGYAYLADADELAERSSSLRLIGDGAYYRARMALDDGDAATAVAASRVAIEAAGERIQGLADDQSADARERNADIYATAARAGIAADDPAVLFEFLEAGRAGSLLESLENREDVREATITEELLGKLEAASRAEARAVAHYRALASNRSRTPLVELKGARDAQVAATAARVAAVRAIQREASFAADLLYPTPATLAEAQAALAEGDVLVLFALLDPDAYALVVERDKARIVPLGLTDELAESCAAPEWRDKKLSATEAMARLQHLAIEPLQLDATTTRLLVSPDGALYQVPFVAIAGARQVALVPSATTYLRLTERTGQPGDRALVVGDPDYTGRPLRQLPGGRKEAELFRKGEHGDLVLLGKDAQESRVRRELVATRTWRVVHLAAHGREDAERPMQSGIALSAGAEDDGWLTAAEVYPMQFRADLVTLSACESGGGRIYRGEGLIGLTRAFLFAGSQRVVCSLWKVDDEATRALMERFYEMRDKNGLSVAAALADAQRHVRGQKGWAHPYYWAGWTVWGLGT